MKRFLVVSLSLAGLWLFSCTGAFDWSQAKFPCSSSRPCASGFTCFGGFCTASGQVPDGGTKPDDARDPDSPYAPALKKPRIAFLYVGPVGDFGWTWAHEQGRLHLKKLGYETTAAETVSVKDAPQRMEEFIKSGYNFIIGTSHDFLVPQLSTAGKHPNTQFLNCSGFETTKNLGSYFGRLYQMEWLAGMVAGVMTKTNKVGIITTIAIPEIVRHVNAFALGVKYMNPKAVVVVKWVGNWFDPKREPVLTQELLDADADVIHSHTDTSIPLEMIENKGKDPLKTKSGDKVHTIGYNTTNACDFGPRTCLTSVYWNWGPILERILTKVKDGKWNPNEVIWERIKQDKSNSSFYITDLSGEIPGGKRLEIKGFIPKLAEPQGQQMPFVGPLKDNTGKERLAKGKELTDKDLLNMCWLADGVVEDDGTTPAKVPTGCKGDH